MEKHLHIICFTVPYPINYGGVYDLFYKLPALQQQGIHIHLHCFDYGQGRQPMLEQYCIEVQYYRRNTGTGALSAQLPYIVSSRRNSSLLSNLLKDDYPILMEGIHCTYLLNDARFTGRKTFIRLHNVEYLYYKSLFKTTSNPVKKMYYYAESKLLKRYETRVASAGTPVFTVSPGDRHIYQHLPGAGIVEYLPLFLSGDWKAKSVTGMGTYCLYHGDLSIAMNEKAALWLVKLFNNIDVPLVIAGKQPPGRLARMISANDNIRLVANPTREAMQRLIAGAHINILPSFSNTGIKIKLLNALFNSRHCLVNTPTVFGTGLEELCHVIDTAEGMKQRIEALYHQPFTTQENKHRQQVLAQIFNNTETAKRLAGFIWP